MWRTSYITVAKSEYYVDLALDGKNLSKHDLLGVDEIAVPDFLKEKVLMVLHWYAMINFFQCLLVLNPPSPAGII